MRRLIDLAWIQDGGEERHTDTASEEEFDVICLHELSSSGRGDDDFEWRRKPPSDSEHMYQERRLLGYKYPVRTSQESHYFSAAEPNRLILCKISDFHGGDYEEYRLLGCHAV
jgi:hypothetical protein